MRDYKKEYKEYRWTPARRKYRAKLNAAARARGIYGKREAMGKDLSHTKSGKLVLEKSSTNRARNWSKPWMKRTAKRTGTKK